MNLISNLLMFLLLMEGMAQNGGQPPSIPYLSLQTTNSDQSVAVYINKSMQYSAHADDDGVGVISKINCDTADYNADTATDYELDMISDNNKVQYSWKVNGDLVTPDNEFIQDENGSLVFIEPVYGLIECFATNEFGVGYSAINILDSDPPLTEPNFEFVHGPAHLSVPINSTVKFNCESSSSDTEIMWTFNAEPFSTNSDWSIVKDELSNKQTLSIVNINSDFVGTIGCFLKAGDVQLYQEGSVQLVEAPGEEKMTAPSVQLDPDLPVHTILTGQPLNLYCEVTGTPDPSVTWQLNETRLDGLKVVEHEYSTLGHSGHYTCYADNLAGTEYKSVFVKVYNATVIQIKDDDINQPGHLKIHPGHLQVEPGHDLSMQCSYDVDTRLIDLTTVNWFHNGQRIESDNNVIESVYGLSKLQVTNMQDENYGNYSCTVNTDLQESSVTWTVDKVSMPKIVSDLPDKLVLQGTLLRLQCDVTGDPLPDVTWSLNGQTSSQESFPGSSVFVDGSIYQIETLDLVHGGVYTCHAGNLVGQVEKEFNVSVAKQTSPPEGKF